ncbi:MAG TPA: class I SAM-dependent methyltransferase [Thermoanaerobaculia bacterium]|jgi:SAM-dependent methyltransferase|nr:class I SAM-dependent methyltransferase [Thermoanaerobaculia bacterium]
MDLAYRTEDSNPLVAAVCPAEVLAGTNLDIHAADEMLAFLEETFAGDRDSAIAVYFQSGRLIWETFREILTWHFRDLDRIGRLLDFASGYGRVTRFLVRDLPPERVWVADIYAEGVRFQEAQLGVHGLVSTPSPADFRAAERFDCILVSSLFSHLPEATFHGWLARLSGLLAPGGLLAFSVHDWSLLHPAREVTPDGFLFAAVSESGSLAKSQYGTCWVTESFVRRAIERAAPGASAHRIPRGFSNFQDLYVVIDRPGADFSGLAVRALPEGYVDSCKLTPPDRLDLSGWVADRATGRPVREVQVLVDGEVLQVCRLFHPRGDVAALLFQNDPRIAPQGWRFAVRLPRGTSRSTGALAIRVIDANGQESILYAAMIDTALLASLQRDLVALDAEIARLRKEHGEALAERRAEADYEISVLEARIAAMENSRFWKIRNGWFGIKRKLGLTREE